MRETTNATIVHRVKGRPQLERRLMGLLRAAIRFSEHRASSAAERAWSAKMADGLSDVLKTVRQNDDVRS